MYLDETPKKQPKKQQKKSKQSYSALYVTKSQHLTHTHTHTKKTNTNKTHIKHKQNTQPNKKTVIKTENKNKRENT